MNKMIKDIALNPNTSNEEKEAELNGIEFDLFVARNIIRGEYSYCPECNDYYMTKSFFKQTEKVPCKICTYEDPINSGGNKYKDGMQRIVYTVCPKGHKLNGTIADRFIEQLTK